MKDNYTSEGSLFMAAASAVATTAAAAAASAAAASVDDICIFIVRTFHSLTRASS